MCIFVAYIHCKNWYVNKSIRYCIFQIFFDVMCPLSPYGRVRGKTDIEKIKKVSCMLWARILNANKFRMSFSQCHWKLTRNENKHFLCIDYYPNSSNFRFKNCLIDSLDHHQIGTQSKYSIWFQMYIVFLLILNIFLWIAYLLILLVYIRESWCVFWDVIMEMYGYAVH